MTQKEMVSNLIDEWVEKAKLLEIPEAMLLVELLYRHYDQ